MSELLSTALVTGGSRGIGRAVARTLADAGYQVFLTYISKPEEAEQTVRDITEAGGVARAFRLDVGDSDSVAALFRDEIRDKVDLAVLVNNAGITKDGLMLRMKDDDFDKVLAINLRGAFLCLREAAKIMTRAAPWKNYQYFLCSRTNGKCRPNQLQRCKGGIDRHDQVGCEGTCAAFCYC